MVMSYFWRDLHAQVLRFYAYWDDTTRYGSRMYFTIHYFLADDTVEINNMCAGRVRSCVALADLFCSWNPALLDASRGKGRPGEATPEIHAQRAALARGLFRGLFRVV